MLASNILIRSKDDIIRVAKLYFYRWRIEEYFRCKKTVFEFENFRIRSLARNPGSAFTASRALRASFLFSGVCLMIMGCAPLNLCILFPVLISSVRPVGVSVLPAILNAPGNRGTVVLEHFRADGFQPDLPLAGLIFRRKTVNGSELAGLAPALRSNTLRGGSYRQSSGWRSSCRPDPRRRSFRAGGISELFFSY